MDNKEYDKRIQELEAQGLTTSDAQGVLQAEKLKKKQITNWSQAMDHKIDIINTTDATKEMLNDTHDIIKIGNMTFLAGDVLEATDPVAFREVQLNYIDSMVSDGEWYELQDGTVVDVNELAHVLEQLNEGS